MAILSAFVFSNNPQEAQQMLLDMKNNNRNADSDDQLGNVVISEETHNHIFKKGVVIDALKHIIPERLNGEQQKLL